MSKHKIAQRMLLALSAVLTSTASLAIYADDTSAPRPGSFQAIILAKDPMFFKRGTAPHAASTSATGSFAAFESDKASRPAPRPGSWEAIILAKDPMFFKRGRATGTASTSATGSFAAFESDKTSRPAPRPGSWEAVILAKDPMFFKRGTASNRPHN